MERILLVRKHLFVICMGDQSEREREREMHLFFILYDKKFQERS